MAIEIGEQITILTTRLAQIDARLDEMFDCPRPTYSVDGQRFDWTQYQEMLMEARKTVLRQLEDLHDIQDGAGFETGQIHVE